MNYRIEAAYRRAGVHEGDTRYDDCTCPGWYPNPGCWEHSETLDRAAWIREQDADWCLERGFDPHTGEEWDRLDPDGDQYRGMIHATEENV